MSDKTRLEFEFWASDEGRFPRAVERSGDGYLLAQTQASWRVWQAAKEKYEPSIKAYYYAVVTGRFIMQDTRSGQLEIYDTEEEAIAACPPSCEVIEIVASAVSAPSTQGEEK